MCFKLTILLFHQFSSSLPWCLGRDVGKPGSGPEESVSQLKTFSLCSIHGLNSLWHNSTQTPVLSGEEPMCALLPGQHGPSWQEDTLAQSASKYPELTRAWLLQAQAGLQPPARKERTGVTRLAGIMPALRPRFLWGLQSCSYWNQHFFSTYKKGQEAVGTVFVTH